MLRHLSSPRVVGSTSSSLSSKFTAIYLLSWGLFLPLFGFASEAIGFSVGVIKSSFGMFSVSIFVIFC
jgi:hypothetical protein